MSTMLVLGATSDIAKATVLKFSSEFPQMNFILAARDSSKLQAVKSDLEIRIGKELQTRIYDVLSEVSDHEALWRSVESQVDIVLCCIGYLGDSESARVDINEADLIIRSNFMGLIPLLTLAGNSFEQKRSGTIIAVSSVAGDRGRASNYVYGSAKSALTSFLSGLRQRLFKSNVSVITVIPGFVDTKMVAGLNLPKLFTASPEQVASDIVKAYKRKSSVIYTLFFLEINNVYY